MRRLITLTLAAALLVAAPASAAKHRFTIRGAGFGHGVGLSQEGARGFAEHGFDYRRILRHYYRGTSVGTLSPGRSVRVLLQSGGPAVFSGASDVGGVRGRSAREQDAHGHQGGECAGHRIRGGLRRLR